ncbi:MAG: thiamine biosynthesis lipoprotein [Verrucomicrobiales bacterium]|jgi:thiamine biosynthesis lipoprotein
MNNKRTSSRRRFLTITGLAGLSGLSAHARPDEAASPNWNWNGVLFGADVSICLHGLKSEKNAKELSRLCFDEMRRLERMFSLFLPDSTICRLNRHGCVEDCPEEFVELVSEACRLHRLTSGAFDITIQPLWKVMDDHDFLSGPMSDALFSNALSKVNGKHVRVEGRRVWFSKPNVGITLNGIAQGFITDAVTDLLHSHGVERALVNMGEYRAIGSHSVGRPWNLGIRAPDAATDAPLIDSLSLMDNQALSVSGGYGYAFDSRQRYHHLLHPGTGKNMPADRSIAVTAPRATLADALSTACAVQDDAAAQSLCSKLKCGLRIYRGKRCLVDHPVR